MSASNTRRGSNVARRTLLKSLAAAAAAPPTGQGAVLADCAAWIALDLEIDRLTASWAALEAFAARNPDWFTLRPEQRLALPVGMKMAAIDRSLEVLSSRRERELAPLSGLRSLTLHDVAGKLAVAARLMQHEDHPAQPLVDTALRELARMKCPGCGMAYVPTEDAVGHP